MKLVRGIWLPESDEHLAAEIARPINPLVDGKGTYQLNKYRAALKHVRRRGHALDVGANVGLWSRVMERDFVIVTAIEPLATHCACFRRNVERALLIPTAVGNETGTVRIATPAPHMASSHVADKGEEVVIVPLDSLGLGRVDFIKIDVEGFELEAVRGGEELIRRRRPVMVVEQKEGNAERYGFGQRDAVELLEAWGMVEAGCIGGDHIMVFP